MKKTMLAAAMAGVAFAALPAFAASETECKQMWTRADANADGVLSGAEGLRYTAYMRIKGEAGVSERITPEVFMKACQADVFKAQATDANAPLKGANSFTEGQAKDRILAAGYTNVSGLKKDADGIWRGTASKTGLMTDAQSGVAVETKPAPSTGTLIEPKVGATVDSKTGVAAGDSVNVAVDYKGNVVTY